MKLLEKILVPIDFESNYQGQVDMAVKLATNFNSEIILLNVLPSEAEIESIKDIILKSVKNELERIINGIGNKDSKAIFKIVYGNTFEQVLTFSEVENVNLILMADENNGSAKNQNLGILTEKLLRKSQKPVWIFKYDGSTELKNILCPVDFSDASKRALNNAIKISRTFKSSLKVVNVFKPLQNNFSPRLNIDYNEENRKLKKINQEKFEDFLKEFNFTDVDYTHELITGEPYKKIIQYVKDKNIDLIFIGTTGKSMISRVMLGSVTEMVARELPSSIVATKSENIINLKIDSEISDIEKHFNQAIKLNETGYFTEAIEQLKACLNINDMHIPSLTELIKLYEKTGETDLAKSYKDRLDEILKRLWDKKIEYEIRKYYKM